MKLLLFSSEPSYSESVILLHHRTVPLAVFCQVGHRVEKYQITALWKYPIIIKILTVTNQKEENYWVESINHELQTKHFIILAVLYTEACHEFAVLQVLKPKRIVCKIWSAWDSNYLRPAHVARVLTIRPSRLYSHELE